MKTEHEQGGREVGTSEALLRILKAENDGYRLREQAAKEAHDKAVARATEWANVAGLNGAEKDAAVLAGRHWQKRAEAAESLVAVLRNSAAVVADYLEAEIAMTPDMERKMVAPLRAALAKTPADMGAELVRLGAQVALDERTKATMLRGGLQEREALRARVAEQEAAWDEQLKNVERLTVRVAELERINALRIPGSCQCGDDDLCAIARRAEAAEARNERLVAAGNALRGYAKEGCPFTSAEAVAAWDAALADNGTAKEGQA